MERRSKQVDQLFGQVGPEPAAPSPLTPDNNISRSSSFLSQQHPPDMPTTTATPTATPHNHPTSNDVWDTLCGGEGPSGGLPYDPATISALTTTGIPVGCSPGGTIPPLQPPPPLSSSSGQLATDVTAPTRVEQDGHTPISDVIFPDNGLLYMAEDLPVFGIWEDA